MICVPPMLPRNYLPGAPGFTGDASSLSNEADAVASIYARAAASSSLAGLPQSSSGVASGATSADLIEYIIAQEKRRQALFASQQNALNADMHASYRLGALMMQRESLLGGGGGLGGLSDQALLARLSAAGGFGSMAGSPPSLGISALGMTMNSALTHGVLPSQAFASPLLMRAQQQLPGFRDQASMAVPDHLVPLLDGSDRGGRKGRTGTFPQKLHLMLSDLESEEGGRDIASWLPHGRAFAIHKPKEFVKSVMPKYFRMSRFSSFQRQLNLYEFQRITEGPDKGAYFHELLLHGRPMLCTQIKRNKIKGAPAHGQNAPLGAEFGVFPMASSSAPAASAQGRQALP